MSKQSKFLLPVVLAMAVFSIARSYNGPVRSKPAAEKPAPTQQEKTHNRIKSGALWPQLRLNLRALGDRLETAGKEQITVSGMISRTGDNGPSAFVMAMEGPRRLTVNKSAGIHSSITKFDGTDNSWAQGNDSDRQLVETLMSDSAEGFFFDQANGAVTRSLGLRFKLDDSTPQRFYDLYAVIPAHQFTSLKPGGAKLFCFNSDSKLLERVKYDTERDGQTISVEVKLENWETIRGQSVARRIERTENGRQVLTIDVNAADFTAPNGK